MLTLQAPPAVSTLNHFLLQICFFRKVNIQFNKGGTNLSQQCWVMLLLNVTLYVTRSQLVALVSYIVQTVGSQLHMYI